MQAVGHETSDRIRRAPASAPTELFAAGACRVVTVQGILRALEALRLRTSAPHGRRTWLDVSETAGRLVPTDEAHYLRAQTTRGGYQSGLRFFGGTQGSSDRA